MSVKKVRVLLAEGDGGQNAGALRALFPEDGSGLELTVVSAVSTLIASLEMAAPEVIFLDLALACPYPVDAVHYVHRAAPAVPLIVIADPAERNFAAQCLSQGALDYVIKGFMDARTLQRVLRGALQHNTLDGLADLLRDAKTGLYIRDGFLTLGGRAMETAKRNNSTLVLLCLRIENLESIRTQFGPSAVETCTCELAGLLSGNFRRTDIVARLGDSQFAALAIDAVEPSVPVLRQRLERRIAVLNRDMGPWGPLDLRMHARSWCPKDAGTFSEFLDSVEAGLRAAPAIPGRGPAFVDKVSRE